MFNLLSLYDPDTTGVGHQPIGFDQLMGSMYDHYTVTRAQIRVQFASVDAVFPQLAILALQDKPGTTSDPSTVIENGRCVTQVLGPRGGSSQVVTLTMDVDMNTFFGRSVLDGDKYMGTSSSSPVEGVYLHVGLTAPQSLNTAGAYVWTELTYHAHLTEPALIGQS